MPLLHDDPILSAGVIKDIIDQVAPYTMVARAALDVSMRAVAVAVREERRGAIVECGVWRGGCSIAMLLAQKAAFGKIVKPIYMLDSYEGLPDVLPIDGPLAQDYQENRYTEAYHNNCAASLEEVKANMDAFGFHEGDYHLVKGWFEQTIPQIKPTFEKEGIAVLRLDCDWYESVKLCLEQLEPLVVAEGPVLIDDYYPWDGCAIAVHEYLGKNLLPYRLRTTEPLMGVYFEKKCRENGAEL